MGAILINLELCSLVQLRKEKEKEEGEELLLSPDKRLRTEEIIARKSSNKFQSDGRTEIFGLVTRCSRNENERNVNKEIIVCKIERKK